MESQKEGQTLKSRLQQNLQNQLVQISIPLAVSELLDFRPLAFEALLHPIEAIKAYTPQLNMFGLFEGKTFNPGADIPDLSGKVILVTGGRPI